MSRKEKMASSCPGGWRAVSKVAIVGLPNTGKTQVFNGLTGEYALVANYPHTTVEVHRTTCEIHDRRYEIIDTPGLHCLYIHSQEELIVRDMIFSEKPDLIIQCIDADRLKQSLTLTADLLELGIPMVISLNAISETARKGVVIDSKTLSELLGVPVVESIAVNGIGPERLKRVMTEAVAGACDLGYGGTIEEGISAIASKLPASMGFKRKTAVLLLLDDPFIADSLKAELGDQKVADLQAEAGRIRRDFRGHLGQFLNRRRSQWVESIAQRATTRREVAPGEFSKVFGRLSRHPVFGIPILVFFLLITYMLVTHVAGFLDGILSALLLDPTTEYVSGLVDSGFWHEFLVGHYGILTLGLFNAIVTVLPILSVFFLMFGFLEDMGYIPNLCVLVRRVFGRVGLTGKAIMPLVLGFGCKTMATLMTRGLASRKEKFIAVYLIAFALPCAAQLGVDMAIFGRVGLKAFVIGYGTLVFIELLAGVFLNRIIRDEEKSDYLQELPAIRLPSLRAVVVKTGYRLYWFLKEAIPIFMLAAVALFVLENTGILDGLKRLMSPIVVWWLGLPGDIVDVFILAIARHEAAAGLTLQMVDEGALDYIQCIVTVVITTMFVPCFANVIAMCKEMGTKTGIAMVVAINASAFVLAGILHWALVLTMGRWVP